MKCPSPKFWNCHPELQDCKVSTSHQSTPTQDIDDVSVQISNIQTRHEAQAWPSPCKSQFTQLIFCISTDWTPGHTAVCGFVDWWQLLHKFTKAVSTIILTRNYSTLSLSTLDVCWLLLPIFMFTSSQLDVMELFSVLLRMWSVDWCWSDPQTVHKSARDKQIFKSKHLETSIAIWSFRLLNRNK